MNPLSLQDRPLLKSERSELLFDNVLIRDVEVMTCVLSAERSSPSR